MPVRHRARTAHYSPACRGSLSTSWQLFFSLGKKLARALSCCTARGGLLIGRCVDARPPLLHASNTSASFSPRPATAPLLPHVAGNKRSPSPAGPVTCATNQVRPATGHHGRVAKVQARACSRLQPTGSAARASTGSLFGSLARLFCSRYFRSAGWLLRSLKRAERHSPTSFLALALANCHAVTEVSWRRERRKILEGFIKGN